MDNEISHIELYILPLIFFSFKKGWCSNQSPSSCTMYNVLQSMHWAARGDQCFLER